VKFPAIEIGTHPGPWKNQRNTIMVPQYLNTGQFSGTNHGEEIFIMLYRC